MTDKVNTLKKELEFSIIMAKSHYETKMLYRDTDDSKYGYHRQEQAYWEGKRDALIIALDLLDSNWR